MALITTPFSAANSYVSVDEAEVILSERLYSSEFAAASSLPSASGHVTSGTLSAGSTTINFTGGTGIYTKGCLISINGVRYKVREATTESSTSLTILAGLSTMTASGTSIVRLTANAQESCLIWSSKILDQGFEWLGVPTYNDQALGWPRYGVYDLNGSYYDSTIVPEIVRRMTAELGLSLLKRDTSNPPRVIGTGLKSFTDAAGQSVEVDPKNTLGLIPPYISNQLAHVGFRFGGTRGFSIVPLVRA